MARGAAEELTKVAPVLEQEGGGQGLIPLVDSGGRIIVRAELRDGANLLNINDDGSIDINIVSIAGGSGLATEAKQDTQITHLAAIEAAVEGTVAVSNAGLTELAAAINTNRVDVNIAADGVGIGGGTEYTEGAIDASPTGKALMWRKTADDSLVSVGEDNPLPVSASIDTTGLALETKQDTMIGHLDGLETLLAAIQTAVELLDNIVKVEDAASGNAHSLAGLAVVRDDALAANAGVDNDGDYTFLRVDNEGSLWSHDLTVAALLTTIDSVLDAMAALLGTIDADTGNLAAILTALQLIDDSVFADDAPFALTTSKTTVAGAIRDDSLGALSAAEGDAVPLRVSARGGLWATLVDNVGQVISTLTPGDAAAADIGLRTTAFLEMFNGATWDRIRGDTTNGLDVDVTRMAALVAGTALIGKASVGMDTDALYQGTTARTVGRAAIDVAGSGDNTLLAAQGASNKIRVHSCFLIASAAVTVRFESGAGGTALTGQMQLAANAGFVLPFNPLGWFETAANTLLNLELSGAISVDGSFQYSVVQ